MVNVKFVRCLEHPVTLAFVKSLLGLSSPPAGIEYIGAKGLKGIQGMALVNRGRLSVQPVEEDAYDAIVALGEKGGWDEDAVGKKPAKAKAAKAPTSASKRKAEDSDGDDGAASTKKTTAKAEPKPKAEAKSKARPKPITEGTRRSSRKRT
jgi:protein phosphatase-4 regulatory subunit 3